VDWLALFVVIAFIQLACDCVADAINNPFEFIKNYPGLACGSSILAFGFSSSYFCDFFPSLRPAMSMAFLIFCIIVSLYRLYVFLIFNTEKTRRKKLLYRNNSPTQAYISSKRLDTIDRAGDAIGNGGEAMGYDNAGYVGFALKFIPRMINEAMKPRWQKEIDEINQLLFDELICFGVYSYFIYSIFHGFV